MTNYTKFAVRGAATVFVVSLVAAFLGYLVRFILAKNLSLEDFGLFYAVYAFLGLLGVFKTFGFDRALVKFIPEFRHEKKEHLIKSSIIYVSVIQFVTNTVIIVLIYLLASYLSSNFFHNAKADFVLKLMAIAFFIDNFVYVVKYCFQGFQKMTLFAVMDLVRMSLIIGIILIGFKLNYGVLSPVIAYVLAPLILLFIYTPILLKNIFPEFATSKFIFDKNLLKRISKYSIFVLATTVGTVVLNYTDSLVLTYFRSLKEVGLYNIASPTAKLLTYFPLAIMSIVLPLASELWAKKRFGLLKAGIGSLYKYTIIVILPLVLIIFSFAELIISVFFGKEFILASNALRILSIGMIFSTLYGVNVSFFSGIGKPEITSKIVYSGAIFNLIFDIILIPFLGIEGAAITTSISFAIMMCYGLVKMKSLIDIKFPLKVWSKSFVAGLLFVLLIWFLKRTIALNAWIETALVLLISGVLYVALLFLLKIVDINEIKDLYRRVIK